MRHFLRSALTQGPLPRGVALRAGAGALITRTGAK
jgi:hypothetical protein